MKQTPKRTGIILAAGIGSRLRESGVKPLIHVNNIGLLLRTIQSHDVAGCDKIIIILGWQAEEIKKHVLSNYNGKTRLQFVQNHKYLLKNGISVLCAKPYVEGEFILTMADHILDDGIMRLASSHCPPKDGATLCVDYKLDTIFDMDDATKVLSEGNLIKRIGKELDEYNCVDTGVFIGTIGLMDALDRVCQQKGDTSLSEGVQALSDAGKMQTLDIGSCFWQDVDTPEMLDHAEKLLWGKKNIGEKP